VAHAAGLRCPTPRREADVDLFETIRSGLAALQWWFGDAFNPAVMLVVTGLWVSVNALVAEVVSSIFGVSLRRRR
jgi:hypothetical protein